MAETDPKMTEAIAFFEQMLQTLPGDRTSLEFLVVAYEQTGQKEKRRDCLIRLADTLLQEKDYDNAQTIAGYLSAFLDDPNARAAVDRVADEVQGQILQDQFQREVRRGNVPTSRYAVEASATQVATVEVHALTRSASAAEMDLVWLWKEREFVPKEVCMDVLHILTERPMTDTPLLVSALALLDEQRPELTDRLMEAMQQAAEIPTIPIELFDVSSAAASALSPSFVQVKGVLPFAQLGNELLVALLNPLNAALMEETAAQAGRHCHFFFVHPRAWQQAAAKALALT